MSNPDIDRTFADLFDAHDAAIRSLREASAAMVTANQAMAMRDQATVPANQAIDRNPGRVDSSS